MDGLQIKFRFLERLKSSFISMRINKIISFSKKMNMGLKSTGSQLLLPFRKNTILSISPTRGRYEKVLIKGKIKRFLESFNIGFRADLIALVNKLTSGLPQYY